MSLDLSTYKVIQSNLFVRLDLTYISTVVRLSDRRTATTIDGESYTAAGNLLGITATSSDIASTENELTITLAGVPNTAISDVINARLKGSKVKIYRGIFNASTNTLISMAGNPTGRFTGIITNYSITEEYDTNTRTATNTIGLVCGNIVGVLANTLKGRRTNPEDQKKFYPGDVSMDRVSDLVGVYFDFGAPT
jgi:hypothetical protein